MEALIEFGKILIPSSIVLYAVYLMVRSFINREIEWDAPLQLCTYAGERNIEIEL